MSSVELIGQLAAYEAQQSVEDYTYKNNNKLINRLWITKIPVNNVRWH
jgi:hypothetical protein